MTTVESPTVSTLDLPLDLRPPSERYGELYTAMCLAEVREDGIDIADLEARFPDKLVHAAWQSFKERNPEGYTPEDVKTLAEQLFIFPVRELRVRHVVEGETIEQHNMRIFRASVCYPELNTSSQIGVSKPGLEPGGRFSIRKRGRGRIYNWDLWPTLRGAVMGMGEWGIEQTHNSLDNADELSRKLDGRVPNVNATWGAKRNQPNVQHRIARLLANYEGEGTIRDYLPHLKRHYLHWREGADDPAKLDIEPGSAYRRVVRMPNGKFMFRHWDDGHGPRDEMLLQDLKTLASLEEALGRPATEKEQDILFMSLRANGEDGEDHKLVNSRNHHDLHFTHTIELAPIKINALQFECAAMLTHAYYEQALLATTPEDREAAIREAEFFAQDAQDLSDCIHEYSLTDDGFCADRDFVTNETLPGIALSGIFALGAGVFDWERGRAMLDVVDERFLEAGGLANTLLYDSTEQWDKNAWPIMQLEAIDAAIQYGRYDLALKWCKVWLASNDLMFAKYGVLYEKSDPLNPGEPGGAGEYACVEDLLMTLGVDMALRQLLPWLKEMAKTMENISHETGALAVLSTLQPY